MLLINFVYTNYSIYYVNPFFPYAGEIDGSIFSSAVTLVGRSNSSWLRSQSNAEMQLSSLLLSTRTPNADTASADTALSASLTTKESSRQSEASCNRMPATGKLLKAIAPSCTR